VPGSSPTSLGSEPQFVDTPRIALIERDHAWRLTAQTLGRARAGVGSVLLFEGPSGIGKSALLSAIRPLAAQTGMQVLMGSGRRRETGFRLGVMVQLLECVFRENGQPKPSEGVDQASELSFDELHGLYTLCRDIARTAPLVLIVDDADLADETSLRCLLYLTERVAELPVAVLLAAGSVAASRGPELLSDIARHQYATRCTLEPLTPRGTKRALAKRWPEVAADEAAAEIHRVSGGSPFLVDALATYIAEQDEVPPARLVQDAAPARIAEWAMARAADVDACAPPLLTAIAVLGQGCEIRHAIALANLDLGPAVAALDRLVEIGILTPDETLSFAQPVVGQGIERAQAQGERAANNLHAARLLGAEDAPPERVAQHLLSAARTGSGWAVDTLCVAAAVALGRATPADAVRYLRRALEEPPPRGKRAHVILELGRAEAMAGEPQAALRLKDAVHRDGELPTRPLAALEAGATLFALGRPNDALSAFETGLEEAGDADSDLVSRLDAGRTTAQWLLNLPSGDASLPPVPDGNETPGDRTLLALHAMQAALRGEHCDEVRALGERALARGALLDDESADGLSYYLATGALAFAGDFQTAEAALTAAIHDAQSRGSVLGFATASHVRAMTILMRGRLDGAATDARHALAVERNGWRLGFGGARMVLATVMVEQADLERARRHLDAADAADGGDDPFRMSLLSVRGRLKLFTGDAEAALENFVACGEIAVRAGITNPAIAPWQADAGLATAVTGNWPEAERLILSELELARKFGAPGPIGRALRSLALISDPPAALEALEEAVETLEGSQAAFERASAMVEFGAALRRSSRRRDALNLLKEGMDLAERCGGHVLVRKAMRELNAAGGRPRRAAIHGQDALTARELQVATLAAEGLSNREIAEALVVTVKTVEWHLGHSYTKLGVSSRRELAGKLTVEGTQPD
jgi:DNA-binding CsgD family transcriptional regulator